MDDFIQDGVRALEKLKALDIRTIIDEEKLRGGLCQRDYKPNHLLEGQDGYRLLDFDDFAGQSHLEDIARFIKEVGDWEAEKIQYIFNVYSEVYHISEPEKEAILAYLKLPLDLWKVARNHYLRDKPQKQNLKKVVQEMNRRKRCFSQLENPKRMMMAVTPTTWNWDLPSEQPRGSSIDEYWNRWNWGDNWQVAGELPMNSETADHAYSYEGTGYNLEGVLPAPVEEYEPDVDLPVEEVWPTQRLEEEGPQLNLDEVFAEVGALEPAINENGPVDILQEFDAELKLTDMLPVTDEVTSNLNLPGPEESEMPLEDQETKTQTSVPVSSAPKMVVWKSFPKPIGK
ncbi:MAG TPA: hypothetical protein VHR47_07650 [Bacillota bacterium]|nr:hypothetical protein [Bacillota bacterium]